MAKSYPRIGQIGKIPKHKHPLCRCGNPATHWVSIEYSYMRDEDDLVSSCDEHKRNLEFLNAPKEK